MIYVRVVFAARCWELRYIQAQNQVKGCLFTDGLIVILVAAIIFFFFSFLSFSFIKHTIEMILEMFLLH